jgi:copper homeostasis protein
MNKIVEICCGSYYDCLQAYKGKADRVELNSALYMGGLTPSIGNLVLTKKNTDLKVICMVRPRGAGFCYEKEDYEAMVLDVRSMIEHGADGIAFGCLDDKCNINVSQIKEVIRIIKSYGKEKEVVFHRAFDCVSDPYKAIKILIKLGVDRILTSGLGDTAIQGIELLSDLQKNFGNKIEILAGGGINAKNVKRLIEYTGITQVHSSCKSWLKDKTTTMNHVSYAYNNDDFAYQVVDSKLVKELVEVVKNDYVN